MSATGLTEDPEIRGQKYVCLSFLSPEELLANKEVYIFEQYMKNFIADLNTLFSGIKAKFDDESKTLAGVLKQYREDKDSAPDPLPVLEGVFDKCRASVDMIDHIRDINSQYFKTSALQDDYNFYKQTNSMSLESAFHEANEFRTSMRAIKVRGVFDTLPEAEGRATFLKKTGDKFDIFVGQVGCWCPWSPNPLDMNQQYAEETLNTLMTKHMEKLSVNDQMFEDRKNRAVAGPSGE